MIEFENKNINGIYASRFIASWLRVGGKLNNGSDMNLFKSWLRELGLGKEDIEAIRFLAVNGKLELQNSAKEFIDKNTINK